MPSKAPSRELLEKFFKNNQMIKSYEGLFKTGNDFQDQIDALQQEIDNVETAAGFETDGTYIQPSGTNYIDTATSVAVANVLLDTAIRNTMTQNTILINSESDFPTINIGGTDYNKLNDNARYLFRKAITFTRGFAADGVYTGTIDIFSTVSAAHVFNNVNCIFYGDATNRFGRLFIRQVSMTGTTNSSLFNKDSLTPTIMGTWNFDDGIIDGIGMGSLNAGLVHRFSNIQNQQSTWDILVTGLSFLNINNVSAVGDLGGTPFGGTQFKIRGNSQGGLSIQTENIVPSGGDKVFDFTELVTPISINGTHHFTILGSGGVYAAGEDKAITAFADAGGGQVTVTSANHNIPDGNFIDIGTTIPFDYAGNFKITNITTNTFEITTPFLGTATGIFNATVVDQTDPRVFVLGARGVDNPDSQIIGALAFAANTTATVIPSSNTWVKVAGTTFELENERAGQTANNELTFTNMELHKVKVSLSLNVISGSGGGSPTFEFRMLKNGSPLQVNGVDIVTKVDTNTATSRFAAVLTTTTVIEGDVFTMEAQNVTNSNNITVTDGTMIID